MSTAHAAIGTGLGPPLNDEARDTPHAAGPRDQQLQRDSGEDASPGQEDKAFATARARLALAGYELSRREGWAKFRVVRWGMVRDLRDLSGRRGLRAAGWSSIMSIRHLPWVACYTLEERRESTARQGRYLPSAACCIGLFVLKLFRLGS